MRDPRVSEDLAGHGHIKVPLIDADAAASLRARVLDEPVASASPMVFSDHALGVSRRVAFRDDVLASIGPQIKALALDQRVVSVSFVVKAPGHGGELGWHVDPSITDERVYRSLSLWVALEHVDGENGAVEVLSGGHFGAPANRGGMHRLTATFPPHEQVLESCRQAGGQPTGPIALEPGEALVYDHRLPHRSGPNRSAEARVALNIGLVPSGAPLIVSIWSSPTRFRHIPLADDVLTTVDLSTDPSSWDGST